MGAARDFTAQRFGALTAPRVRYIAVNQGPLLIRENNPNALLLFITNIGTTNISLSYEPNPDTDPQFLLIGNGAGFLSRVDLDGDVVGYPIYAWSSAPNGRVAVNEVVQVVTTTSQEG